MPKMITPKAILPSLRGLAKLFMSIKFSQTKLVDQS